MAARMLQVQPVHRRDARPHYNDEGQRSMKQLAIAASVWFAAQALAGPFGLSQGASLDDIRQAGEFTAAPSEFTLTARTIANGHPDFDFYSVLATPKQGLCSIVAQGKDLYTNAYGRQLKGKFYELTSALSVKYGTPRVSLDISKTIDLSRNFGFWNLDGIWIDDDAWMEDLFQRKRSLIADWQASNADAMSGAAEGLTRVELPDALARVSLEAIARSPSSAYLRLEYRFKNYKDCTDAVLAKRNANL
jgi:hypothetical protein